jgi:hypothetical protein
MAVSESILDDAGATEALIKTWLGGDDHTNFEPVHDDAEDINATDFNRLVKGLAEVAHRLRAGNLVAIAFEATGLAATATVQANLAGTGKTTMLLPKDAKLVGITAKHSAAISGGTLTVQPQIATVNTTLTAALSSSAQSARAHQIEADAAAADALDAGDLDEVEVDITTASLAPTGNDVHGLIWFAVQEDL